MASQSSPLKGMGVPTQRLPESSLTPSEQPLQCPRCDSTNTKFCYYNNYSLSQPRYFCKSCRRYWTKGGTLRNVPVGGGCRKIKSRPKSKKAARFNTQFSAMNSGLAGMIYSPVDFSLLFSGNERDFPVVANCGGFPGFLGSPRGGFFLQTAENHDFVEGVGSGIVGNSGGGIDVGPYVESVAMTESFSGGGRVFGGSQEVSPDNGVGSRLSSEGWAGLGWIYQLGI